ncbi:MAG: UDP-N-acetylglucosamine 1-carboxyvinyltransferase with a repressor domain, partial [Blastococcus sp.]|nr:UDP-N-acetylglucosamine 1-carboxyvinyltransferase with a repressor domain [Blastococcus sp.]
MTLTDTPADTADNGARESSARPPAHEASARPPAQEASARPPAHEASAMHRIGALVRDARRHHGLTQQQLADRLGTSQSAVARIEQGN